jgi:hypothetical protein
MNSGGISRSRGKGRYSPPPGIDPSKIAGANVTITPSTPKFGPSKKKGASSWGYEAQPWGVVALLLLAILLQTIILVRMGLDNVVPSLLKPLLSLTISGGKAANDTQKELSARTGLRRSLE